MLSKQSISPPPPPPPPTVSNPSPTTATTSTRPPTVLPPETTPIPQTNTTSSLHHDGTSPRRPLLSPALHRNPDTEFTYLVHHLGQWFLTNAQEARQYHALGFRVYNNDGADGEGEGYGDCGGNGGYGGCKGLMEGELREVGEWVDPWPEPGRGVKEMEWQVEEIREVEEKLAEMERESEVRGEGEKEKVK